MSTMDKFAMFIGYVFTIGATTAMLIMLVEKVFGRILKHFKLWNLFGDFLLKRKKEGASHDDK